KNKLAEIISCTALCFSLYSSNRHALSCFVIVYCSTLGICNDGVKLAMKPYCYRFSFIVGTVNSFNPMFSLHLPFRVEVLKKRMCNMGCCFCQLIKQTLFFTFRQKRCTQIRLR